MSDPAPPDAAALLDAASFDAFLLGVRVVLHAYELDPPATEFERPWSLLREIANGDTALTNPADTAARFPGLGELLYESAGQMIAHDRAVASRILRGLGGAFDQSGAG
ncbi:MAG: hypothetical protein ACREKM_04300 [Longimicrobiales bacterium]